MWPVYEGPLVVRRSWQAHLKTDVRASPPRNSSGDSVSSRTSTRGNHCWAGDPLEWTEGQRSFITHIHYQPWTYSCNTFENASDSNVVLSSFHCFKTSDTTSCHSKVINRNNLQTSVYSLQLHVNNVSACQHQIILRTD